jgi:hypothetical protein
MSCLGNVRYGTAWGEEFKPGDLLSRRLRVPDALVKAMPERLAAR